ncbi:MAG: ATP-binding protein [Treponema sp.]|nr:ATP-binding protein [Treponema sp.]
MEKMAGLKIKYFGPIKDGFSENGGFLEISPVTVICGNQATGKSTVAKLYSTCAWLEKKVDSGEFPKRILKSTFLESLAYHKIDCYLKKESEIQYIGESCKITYSDQRISVDLIKDADYIRPKIVYIPAERNFCTAIENASSLKGLAKDTFDFLSDYMIAANSLKNSKYKLPLNGYEYRYDPKTNTSYVADCAKDYEIDIVNASSGLQSLSPMALTSAYYSQFIADEKNTNTEFSFDQKKRWSEGVNEISIQNNMPENSIQFLSDALAQYKNKTEALVKFETERDKQIFKWLIRIINSRFINVVEEPEQNLYPQSQAEVLYYLLQCFNTQSYNTTEKIENKLLITTHSPYILAYLTQSAKAAELLEKGVPEKEIEKIVPVKAAVDGSKITIYETKADGTIKLLKPYKSLPSDDNELNKALEEQNESFSDLLELEAKFCK